MAMTVRDWVVECCVQHGLSEDHATAAATKVATEVARGGMRIKWGDEVDEYPTFLRNLLTFYVRDYALAVVSDREGTD